MDKTISKGIDVSELNGNINWEDVINYGIDFVIVRLGYGNKHLDEMFYSNINNAINFGLKIGVYYYSYALNVHEAESEADFVIKILTEAGIKPDKLAIPIWFDMEDADGWKMRNGMPDKQTITDMCSRFICRCNEKGYECGIYANLEWFINKIDTRQLSEYVPYWVAQWGTQSCDWGKFLIWQYTDKLNINGQFFDGNYLKN